MDEKLKGIASKPTCSYFFLSSFVFIELLCGMTTMYIVNRPDIPPLQIRFLA